jgi:hypothetical protein
MAKSSPWFAPIMVTTSGTQTGRIVDIIEVGPVDITLPDGGRERLKSGDMTLLASGIPHRLRCPAEGTRSGVPANFDWQRVNIEPPSDT